MNKDYLQQECFNSLTLILAPILTPCVGGDEQGLPTTGADHICEIPFHLRDSLLHPRDSNLHPRDLYHSLFTRDTFVFRRRRIKRQRQRGRKQRAQPATARLPQPTKPPAPQPPRPRASVRASPHRRRGQRRVMWRRRWKGSCGGISHSRTGLITTWSRCCLRRAI